MSSDLLFLLETTNKRMLAIYAIYIAFCFFSCCVYVSFFLPVAWAAFKPFYTSYISQSQIYDTILFEILSRNAKKIYL